MTRSSAYPVLPPGFLALSQTDMCHPERAWSQAGLCPVPVIMVFYYTAFVGVRFMASPTADKASCFALNL